MKIENNLELFHFHQKYVNILCIKFLRHNCPANWMSILKICTFAPLNAGGFISALFSIFMPHNSIACIDRMTFVRGNERFTHPVCNLERNFQPHNTQIHVAGRGKKIGKSNTVQSCASFAFYCLMNSKSSNWNGTKSVGFSGDSIKSVDFFSLVDWLSTFILDMIFTVDERKKVATTTKTILTVRNSLLLISFKTDRIGVFCGVENWSMFRHYARPIRCNAYFYVSKMWKSFIWIRHEFFPLN